MDKDEQDFRQFMAQFNSLAANDIKARELAGKVGRLYDEYLLLGRALMDGRDRAWILFDTFAADLAKLDRVIDDDLLARIDRGAKDGTTKALAASHMEADLAEVGTWLGVYLVTHQPQPKVRDDIANFRAELAHLKRLALTPNPLFDAAEGVEESQLAALRSLGCVEIQGYLISRSCEPDAFAAKIRSGFGARLPDFASDAGP